MNAQHKHSTIDGMRADYSLNAMAQSHAISAGLERATTKLIKPLAKRSKGADVLHFVDLGAADGVNSFAIIDRFAAAFSDTLKGTELHLQVSHLDVPEADLSALAQNICKHPASYRNRVRDRSNLTISSSILPASFYTSYLPPNSADVVFGTVSLHYASRIPGPVSNHIDPVYAQGDEREAWQNQSAIDLDKLLHNVHSALKQGGKFWAVTPAHVRDAKGTVANHWYRELWSVVMQELEALQDEGALDTSTLANCILPIHQRGKDDWERWFANHSDLFQLEYLELVEQDNPYLLRYRDIHEDPSLFADEYLASVRAWADMLFREIIPDDALRSRFFNRLHAAFRQDPERFDKDAVSVYVGATRI